MMTCLTTCPSYRLPYDGRLKNLCSIENETEIKDASKILVIVSLTGLVFIYE